MTQLCVSWTSHEGVKTTARRRSDPAGHVEQHGLEPPADLRGRLAGLAVEGQEAGLKFPHPDVDRTPERSARRWSPSVSPPQGYGQEHTHRPAGPPPTRHPGWCSRFSNGAPRHRLAILLSVTVPLRAPPRHRRSSRPPATPRPHHQGRRRQHYHRLHPRGWMSPLVAVIVAVPSGPGEVTSPLPLTVTMVGLLEWNVIGSPSTSPPAASTSAAGR